MAEALLVKAEPGHAAWVAKHIRDADRNEVWASSRRKPHDALIRSLMLSSHSWTALIDGEPVAVFGVGPASLSSGIGVPWLLGTDRLDRHPRPLLELSRGLMPHIIAVYPHLENYVDARNLRSIRWLACLGFTLHPAAPYGPLGLPFHRFTMGW